MRPSTGSFFPPVEVFDAPSRLYGIFLSYAFIVIALSYSVHPRRVRTPHGDTTGEFRTAPLFLLSMPFMWRQRQTTAFPTTSLTGTAKSVAALCGASYRGVEVASSRRLASVAACVAALRSNIGYRRVSDAVSR